MSSSYEAHDVFVSFRGDDTRTNFTSHLYNALSQRSIRTYIDDKLEKGEDVWPALARAIESSHVAIVVFSENYASSKWCLEELVKILECRKQQGQIVIPVFYEVDPSDIRKQTGSYEKGFAKHERDPIKEKVLKWRAALTEAANISGWDSRTHKNESQVINNVVGDVLQKLHFKYPTELKGLVGAENDCKKVEGLLKYYRVIGIWGMGGIGKSTIAKSLFAKHFAQYDHVCFVANAKEYPLNKLFSELLKEEVYTSNVVGSTFDMKRLSSKKVFIVLDDVDMDRLETFEFLYREYDVQHRDSRLIITTRNKQLLVGRVDEIYEVKEWKNSESLELFCKEAFQKSSAPKDFESLSQRAVAYAQGIPLALKVLGSYFRSKNNIKFWEDTLDKLKTHPNKEIQKVLQVSYTGLDDLERNIFLDIAFFFKEKEVDHVMGILDACAFKAANGIEVLTDRALVTISESYVFPKMKKQIQMHDLLQQMGMDIVREECSADTGKRSRLKDKEAREVIVKDKGTDVIQGIALDLSQIEDLPLRADTFTKMKSLRFLKVYYTLGQSSSNVYLNLPATLEPFSDELRYIEWVGYPFESLPLPFCAKFLVEIHMPQSKVKQLWQGIQELGNLKGIELSECKKFEELPNLSKAPRLKWVNLTYCESLQYLHPSVLSSDTLETLILDGCTKLKSVKGEKHLTSLEEISVNGSSSLEEFAVSSDLIKNLDLSNTGIKALDSSIGRMPNIKRLNVAGLELGHPLKELSHLTSLRELELSDSTIVIEEQQLCVLFVGLRSLVKLHMKDLSNLFELPKNISVLSELEELRLDRSNVKRLPENIQNLEKLEILSLENCKELQCLPTLPSRIKYLGAINCSSLVSVSSLNTLATQMFGMTKTITFNNSLKLDGLSCKLIVKSLQLTMMNAVFDNMYHRYFDYHGFNYTSVDLCVPGSRVPWHVKYQSTKSFIVVELPKYPNLLGLIYSVVLSPADGTKKLGTRIKCTCYLSEGDAKEAWLNRYTGELNSDHVYIWYDPYHCDRILHYYEQKVRFEFCVANEEGEVDYSISIKECAIRFVSISEVPIVLEELDLGESGENRLTRLLKDIQSNSFTDGHIIVGPESGTDELESVEDSGKEDHFSDVEESVGYTRKEIKTGARSRDSITEYTEVVSQRMQVEDASLHDIIESQLITEYYESEGQSITQSKLVVMVELESAKDNNGSKDYFSGFEESIESGCKATKTTSSRGPEEKSTKSTTILKEIAKTKRINRIATKPEYSDSEAPEVEVDVKDTSSPLRAPSPIRVEEVTNEPSQSTSLQASSKRGSENLHNTLDESKQIVETQETGKSVTKYSSLNLEYFLQQFDENPFAILDLLPQDQLSHSLKQSETNAQNEAQEDDVTTVLNQFRTLVFSTSLLKKLPDQAYQQQITESLHKLQTYRQEMTEEQKAGFDKFIKLYNEAVNISQDKMLTEDELKKMALKDKELYSKIHDSELEVQQFDTTISTSKSEIENIQGRQREIQETIKKLQEEYEVLEKDRSKLESLHSEQEAKKKKILQSVKDILTPVVDTRNQLVKLKEKRLSLVSAYNDLEEPYQRMKTNPPF